MELGDAVKFKNDPENNTYFVRGIDPISQRIWLCIDHNSYDGYNGDIIVSQDDSDDEFAIVLANERCCLPRKLRICQIYWNL